MIFDTFLPYKISIMPKKFFPAVFLFFALICSSALLKAQAPSASLPSNDPWNQSELLAPSALAGQIKEGHAPLIFNIGAVEDIKTARHIGPVSDANNLAKFKEAISSLKKSDLVVIYCGCCKLPKCPNVRPAYKELRAQGFTNIRVLDLETNLKTNWIAMGYPLAAK